MLLCFSPLWYESCLVKAKLMLLRLPSPRALSSQLLLFMVSWLCLYLVSIAIPSCGFHFRMYYTATYACPTLKCVKLFRDPSLGWNLNTQLKNKLLQIAHFLVFYLTVGVCFQPLHDRIPSSGLWVCSRAHLSRIRGNLIWTSQLFSSGR